jgi:hypothetical protein
MMHLGASTEVPSLRKIILIVFLPEKIILSQSS